MMAGIAMCSGLSGHTGTLSKASNLHVASCGDDAWSVGPNRLVMRAPKGDLGAIPPSCIAFIMTLNRSLMQAVIWLENTDQLRWQDSHNKAPIVRPDSDRRAFSGPASGARARPSKPRR